MKKALDYIVAILNCASCYVCSLLVYMLLLLCDR